MKRTLGLLIMLAIAGCALPPPDACADFDAVRYCPQSTAGVMPFTATRAVALSNAQGTQRLIVHVEADARGLRMAGLTPFGRRVLWIQLDADQKLESQSDVPIDVRATLAGLQFSDWPLEQVRASVRGVAARVEETALPTGSRRRLLDGNKEIMIATCEGTRPLCRRARLEYPTMGLTLDIESLETGS